MYAPVLLRYVHFECAAESEEIASGCEKRHTSTPADPRFRKCRLASANRRRRRRWCLLCEPAEPIRRSSMMVDRSSCCALGTSGFRPAPLTISSIVHHFNVGSYSCQDCRRRERTSCLQNESNCTRLCIARLSPAFAVDSTRLDSLLIPRSPSAAPLVRPLIKATRSHTHNALDALTATFSRT